LIGFADQSSIVCFRQQHQQSATLDPKRLTRAAAPKSDEQLPVSHWVRSLGAIRDGRGFGFFTDDIRGLIAMSEEAGFSVL
jgi:hypothetical protein